MRSHIIAHCCEVMYFGCFDFRGELGFLNCDDICMCVVNEQFELIEFVFDSVYVDLQYDEIYLTFSARSVCLCGGCSPVVVLGLTISAGNGLAFAEAPSLAVFRSNFINNYRASLSHNTLEGSCGI